MLFVARKRQLGSAAGVGGGEQASLVAAGGKKEGVGALSGLTASLLPTLGCTSMDADTCVCSKTLFFIGLWILPRASGCETR